MNRHGSHCMNGTTPTFVKVLSSYDRMGDNNMENLLEILCDAKNQHVRTDIAEIHRFASDITKASGGITCDWDEWCGEEWMSILENKKLLAILSIKIPIIFILAEALDAFKPYELIENLYCVVIEDFDKEMWVLDLDEYKRIIPELEWHSSDDVVDSSSFSTEGFWFATI